MIQKKLVQCQICKQLTGLYRVERDEYKRKIYICSKHPKKEAVVKNKSIVDEDMKFYEYIWKKRNHHCFECGTQLHKLDKWFFHHVLGKARYPYFRHDERNIVLVCRKHHGEAESAISYPKMEMFDTCENIKKKLLSDYGIEYESKTLIHTP